VVPDFDTEEGLTFLRDAVTFAARQLSYLDFSIKIETKENAVTTCSACSRFTFLHNPASPNSDPGRQTHVSSLFSHLIRKDLLSKGYRIAVASGT
jgi:hypothetical protein